MHPSLVNLLESCWNTVPDKRPSFDQIIDMIDEAMIDCSIPDEYAAQLWKENWKGKDEITFNKFITTLFKNLEIPLGKNREQNLDYKCMKAILST
jgi:hypothetical protein